MTIFGDVELAFTQSVPQLDGSVSGSGDDLSVVSGEGDGQNVTGVTDESSSGFTGVQVPQSQSLVPRSGQGELTVGRDDNVRDEVVVTVQDLLGVTVFAVFSGELPDDDLLVSGTSQDHVGVFAGGGDGGDGTTVTDTSTLVDDLLGHFEERL